MNSSENGQFNNNGFNSSDEEQVDIRNLCSWLLLFSPQELAIFTSIFAIIITQGLTLAEQAVVGSFLVALSDNIILISAQQLLINTAMEEQEKLNQIEKNRIEKEKAKKEQELTKLEKERDKAEIRELKLKIEKMEELLNHHLKNSL